MALKTFPLILIYFWTFSLAAFAQNRNQFIFNGFQEEAALLLDGVANIYPNGLLQLTNTPKQLTARVFYRTPVMFDSSYSFSTTYAFAMYPEIRAISGHGIVFIISPSTDFRNGVPGKYFGLFNASSNGRPSNHIFAVELDTIQDLEFSDIDSNHVGIDVNSLISSASASAGYFPEGEGRFKNLSLLSAKPMQVWIDYNDKSKMVNVTMAPLGLARPSRPLLTSHVDLSEVFLDTMYVGFSSSTGSVASSHFLLGWSFSNGGQTQRLDLSKLPSILQKGKKAKQGLGVTILVIIISAILVIIISAILLITVLAFYIMRRMKYEEVLEDWEQDYGHLRLSYKDLYLAAKGFKESELLGSGGFGKVFKGVLPSIGTQVAVKRVSHDSKQGMKEFVAEIASMRRLRHRNLVQLVGYCRRKGELLLVYDYMPNGSLDNFLFCSSCKPSLSWPQRINVIKGVASALLYLHEECEQVVLHRDVKVSNILLDADMNAKLGDFGLAKLYDHGSNPQSTRLVGTLGYLAPEFSRSGKPSTGTDVFAFGIFLLEVASGKRSLGQHGSGEDDFVLVDWIYDSYKKGAIVNTADPRLEGEYRREEMELILKLGLRCSHPKPKSRPSMRHVVQYLHGDATLPDVPSDYDYESEVLGDSRGTSALFAPSIAVSFATMSSDNSVRQYGR